MTRSLPTAYGGCTCECHTTGSYHVIACCYPDQSQDAVWYKTTPDTREELDELDDIDALLEQI